MTTALAPIERAELPATYANAKTALATCARIDECKDWADRAAALASYGKQANDDELFTMATRIKARAIRRAGELLQEIEPAHGANQNIKDGAVPNVVTRESAADDAGLSERQRKTALRIANVPADLFEQQIESETPPTLGELAEQGTRPANVVDLGSRSPEEFKAATGLIGVLNHISRQGLPMDLDFAVRGLSAADRVEMVAQIDQISTWLAVLRRRL